MSNQKDPQGNQPSEQKPPELQPWPSTMETIKHSADPHRREPEPVRRLQK